MIKWIILEGMFEGTLEQFADCFFSNVDEDSIQCFAEQQGVECRIFYAYGVEKNSGII